MWYAANLLFKSTHSQSGDDELWEESIRLVDAESEDMALKKAQIIGANEKVAYLAQEGDKVTWEFVRVDRVFEISDEQLRNGAELFSRFLRKSEVESMLKPFDD